MALIKCSECGKEISDTSKVCIHCGYSLKRNSMNNKKKIILYVIIGYIALAIIISIGMYFEESSRQDTIDKYKEDIDYKMEEYEDTTEKIKDAEDLYKKYKNSK